MIEELLTKMTGNLVDYLGETMVVLADYLGIDTKIVKSSELTKAEGLHAQDRVIDICKVLNADSYYNPIGGVDLYNEKDFWDHRISLKFLKTNDIRYRQFSDEFFPNLSIIDVMMFNSREEISELLEEYGLY